MGPLTSLGTRSHSSACRFRRRTSWEWTQTAGPCDLHARAPHLFLGDEVSGLGAWELLRAQLPAPCYTEAGSVHPTCHLLLIHQASVKVPSPPLASIQTPALTLAVLRTASALKTQLANRRRPRPVTADPYLLSAPPVHLSPSTFPLLSSSPHLLPPLISQPLSQNQERISGPPAHGQSVPAGPGFGSPNSELGIGPKVFSALSTDRPLAPAWGRGLWLWKCKVGGSRERGQASAGGRSSRQSPRGRESACVQLNFSGQTPLPAPPTPAPGPQLSRARCAPAASRPSRAPLSPRLATFSPLPPTSPLLPGFLTLAAGSSLPLGGLCPG
ncbi:uncharacterized protein LOC135323024 [Camelus dromedarius]|uniref:uncharacterized protein LOC135323024 n=1 Tax=Camelus dromedarius TaxID=9838 RepID=UPI00311A1315